MLAEIISIGDELLIGQVVNTNASFISRELGALGVRVARVTTVGDDPKALLTIFRRAWKEADIVIATGGLGPTHDDVSKAIVAKFFGRTMKLHKPTLARVRERFRKAGYDKMPDVNIGQAMVPEGFVPLKNEKGTAPGLLYHEEGKSFVILPGVPIEMEHLMTTGVVPALRKAYRGALEVIRHRTILTTGIGESLLASKIGDTTTLLRPGTTLAFLPKAGSVRMRITVHAKRETDAMTEIARVEQHLRKRAAAYIYGTDDDAIEATVLDMLRERKRTLSTAESCTGGLIAERLTAIPGSSAAFVGGVVAYANEAKTNLVGVRTSTLKTHGAVSEAVVRELAEGAVERFGSDFALATTGIAGPDGGTPEKPVGLIWIALAERGGETTARKLQLDYGRALNRDRAATAALDLLRKRLVEGV